MKLFNFLKGKFVWVYYHIYDRLFPKKFERNIRGESVFKYILQKECGEDVSNIYYDKFINTLTSDEKRLYCFLYLLEKNERELSYD